MQERKDTNRQIPKVLPIRDKMEDLNAIYQKDVSYSDFFRNIGNEDIKELNNILNKKNIIEAYNAYVDQNLERIMNTDVESQLGYIKLYIQYNGYEKAKDIFKNYGYDHFDNEDDAREYFKAKIQLYNYILNKHIEMLKSNYVTLNMSIKNRDKIIDKLKSGDDVKYVIESIYDEMTTNPSIIKKYTKPWGFDFSEFGGGKVFFDKRLSGCDRVTLKRMLSMSFVWDVVVVTHGGVRHTNDSLNNQEYEIVTKYNEIRKRYANAVQRDDFIVDQLKKVLSPEALEYFNAKVDNIKKLNAKYFNMYYDKVPFATIKFYLNKLKNYWGVNPLLTPYGLFTTIDDICMACIQNGDKKIKILCCNPGHMELENDYSKFGDDVIIEYELRSVFIENAFTESLAALFNKIKKFFTNGSEMVHKFLNNMKSSVKSIIKKEKYILSTEDYITIGEDGRATFIKINSVHSSSFEEEFIKLNTNIVTSYDKKFK